MVSKCNWQLIGYESKMNETSQLENITDNNILTETMRFDGYVIVVLLITIMIIGSNTLILVVVSKEKAFQSKLASRLIVILAAVDLFIGVMLSTYIPNMVFGRWVFGDTWCSLSAAIRISIFLTEYFIIAFISLERYVAICRPLHYHRILSRKTCIVVAIFAITVVSGYTMVPLVIGMPTVLTEEVYACMLQLNHNVGYTVVFRFLGCILPLCAVMVSNIKILLAIRKQNRSIQALNRQQQQPIKVDKGSFISVMLVMILCCTMLPLLVFNALKNVTHFQINLFWPTMIMLSNSFWNLFVYTFWNKAFRRGLLKVLCCKRSNEDPVV